MIELTFNKNDKHTAEDYKSGLWDKKDIEMATRIIKDTDRVMDIGANVGMFSVNVASKKKCKIYAEDNVFVPVEDRKNQQENNYWAIRKEINPNDLYDKK